MNWLSVRTTQRRFPSQMSPPDVSWFCARNVSRTWARVSPRDARPFGIDNHLQLGIAAAEHVGAGDTPDPFKRRLDVILGELAVVGHVLFGREQTPANRLVLGGGLPQAQLRQTGIAGPQHGSQIGCQLRVGPLELLDLLPRRHALAENEPGNRPIRMRWTSRSPAHRHPPGIRAPVAVGC